MSYSDQQLRDAVDAVFSKYDADNSNSLDSNEVTNLINDALKHMKANRQVSKTEVEQFVTAVDKSGDGKIQKAELFEIFKKVLWVIGSYILFFICEREANRLLRRGMNSLSMLVVYYECGWIFLNGEIWLLKLPEN